jgi:hypothetical protein
MVATRAMHRLLLHSAAAAAASLAGHGAATDRRGRTV